MAEFIIKPAETEAEFLQAGRLSARVFGSDDPDIIAERVTRLSRLKSYPGFDYGWYRLGVVAGQVVTNVLVWPFELRYGRATIPFGGVAIVCTHPDYRGRGFAFQVMNDARQYMVERGDLLALLGTGLDGFYTPLGYHNVWPNHALEFPAEAAANLEAPLPMRPATPDDMPQMAALFEREWAHRVTRVRSPELWQWRMNTDPRPYLQVVEADGAIVGYIAANDETGQGGEVVVGNLAAAQTIMATVGRLRHDAGHDMVGWGVAPDDSPVYYARQLLNPVVHTYYAAKQGWMGSVIDPVGLRDALLPEITAVSGLAENDFDFDIHADSVHIQKDRTSVSIPHSDFLPLLFGAIPPTTLDTSPDAVDLLSALFAPRISQMAQWDWF